MIIYVSSHKRFLTVFWRIIRDWKTNSYTRKTKVHCSCRDSQPSKEITCKQIFNDLSSIDGPSLLRKHCLVSSRRRLQCFNFCQSVLIIEIAKRSYCLLSSSNAWRNCKLTRKRSIWSFKNRHDIKFFKLITFSYSFGKQSAVRLVTFKPCNCSPICFLNVVKCFHAKIDFLDLLWILLCIKWVVISLPLKHRVNVTIRSNM